MWGCGDEYSFCGGVLFVCWCGGFFVSERESLSHFRMLNKVILKLVH